LDKIIIITQGVPMKRIKKTLALIFAISFVFAGCGNPPGGTKPGTQMNKTIVCFGDSLTEGYGASRPGVADKSKSYPAFLQNKVSGPVVNSGISGDTASGGLARLDRDVLSKEPGMVIILLGANDFLRMRAASETRSDLKQIINKLKADNCKIYLASFIGNAGWEASIFAMFPVLSSSASLLSDYKKMFTELTKENRNVGYIPNIWTGVWGIHMSDPIHPNAEGYEIIANTIFKAIKPALSN
jgi:acyl-CoA thioesterase-1